MEKSFNLKVLELKEVLTQMVINSKLPISVANLVVQDFANTIQRSTDIAINNEMAVYKQALIEENAEKENKQEA